MEDRIQYLMAVIGTKGVGKTFLTKKQIREYLIGNPSAGIPGRRVLIMDVNNEFDDIRSIPIQYVKAFSQHPRIEARRILPFNNDGTPMSFDEMAEAVFQISKDFRNGLLLLEDINLYISDNMPKDIVGSICTNRHRNVDLIIHYQSIGNIQPKVWRNMNILRFHKINDSVESNEKKWADKAECFSIAENIVNEAYKTNKRFFLYVMIQEMKILPGDYPLTQQMVRKAIETYVSLNYNSLVGKKRRMYNPANPKSKPTDEQLFKEEVKRITEKYFN